MGLGIDVLDILDLLSESLRQQARDALVDFVANQARKLGRDDLGDKIERLRSDADFNGKFEAGLQRAVRRFVQEYETEDEDLVAAIAADEGLFNNEEVRSA